MKIKLFKCVKKMHSCTWAMLDVHLCLNQTICAAHSCMAPTGKITTHSDRGIMLMLCT